MLATASRRTKDGALLAMADALHARTAEILAANAEDVARARSADTPDHLVDRLCLDPKRVAGMADGLRQVAGLPDPVGEVLRGSVLPNGLELRQVRVPLGVVGIIYEARPNVTADAAGLCLKSGNAVLLRGSSTARTSNAAIVEVLRAAIAAVGLPPDTIQLIDATSRESAKELMRARGVVDVLIPRGGADLIRSVVEESTVPVIETGVGNCHVYVDDRADVEKAVRIADNAKTQRYGTCNTMETLLVARGIARKVLPPLCRIYAGKGIELRGDDEVRRIVPGMKPATEDDWYTEYLDAILSVRVVKDLDEAIEHIANYGSQHTDAIVTGDKARAQRFLREVDSSSVMVNASTRFADGYEYGLGAEVGISTDKLHARGPVGLEGLTSLKWVVLGTGQIRK